MIKCICILLIMLSSTLCHQFEHQKRTMEYPTWINNAVFYQIYPQSFKDSNGDGIGDLQGILSKLDYVKSLDVDAIWLNPVFESPFLDAGYDVSDYYRVAARYGTNKEMEDLIREAHQRDIKVILDLVAGHTSMEHPWFKASSEDSQGEYADRYIWSDETYQHKQFVKGNHLRKGKYYKNFFETQPALNYGYGNPDPDHPWEEPTTAEGPVAMREELKNIIKYWMDMGADGFRVDMASSLVKNDPGYVETNKLWGNISDWFAAEYPQGVLIAEWSNPAQAMKAGFMIDFMMHFGVKGYRSLFFEKNSAVLTYQGEPFFSKKGKGDAMEFVRNFLEQRELIGNQGLIALPTSNHDFQRIKNANRSTDDEVKVALVFEFTWPCIPFLYYGDEIGMRFSPDSLTDKEGSVLPAQFAEGRRANRAGSRTPMQWGNDENSGFSTAEASVLYLPIDPAPDRPTVASQENDKDSQLNFVRSLIQLKKTQPELDATSDIEIIYGKPDTYPLIYKRKSGDSELLVCLNPSGTPVTVELNIRGVMEIIEGFNQGVSINMTGNKQVVNMDGVSYAIARIK